MRAQMDRNPDFRAIDSGLENALAVGVGNILPGIEEVAEMVEIDNETENKAISENAPTTEICNNLPEITEVEAENADRITEIVDDEKSESENNCLKP